MQLNDSEAGQRNYRNYIEANLQNTAATMIRQLKVEAAVFTEDGKEVLYQASDDSLRMAPNSNFDFGISLANTPFKPGKYRIEMNVTADKKEFTFKKNFQIKGEKAKEFNQQAVLVKAEKIPLWVIIGGVAVGLLIVLVVVLLILVKRGRTK